jgi:hypothetical protein
MQPGVSQVDRQPWLFTRGATVLFGIAAVLSLSASILMHGDLTLETYGFLGRREVLVLGLACAVGYISLFAGMCDFWMNCDVSSKLSRTVWFLVVLLGCTYGSQIAYYAFVYLPAVAKRLRYPGGEATGTPAEQVESRPGGIGTFGWVLLAGWGLFSLTFAAHFAFRVEVRNLLYPHLKAVVLWPLVMLVATVLYAIVRAFRAGIRRPASP